MAAREGPGCRAERKKVEGGEQPRGLSGYVLDFIASVEAKAQ